MLYYEELIFDIHFYYYFYALSDLIDKLEAMNSNTFNFILLKLLQKEYFIVILTSIVNMCTFKLEHLLCSVQFRSNDDIFYK